MRIGIVVHTYHLRLAGIVLGVQKMEQPVKKISTKTLLAYGVYQIEAGGLNLFESVKGERSSIMGLPIKQIIDYIKSST